MKNLIPLENSEIKEFDQIFNKPEQNYYTDLFEIFKNNELSEIKTQIKIIYKKLENIENSIIENSKNNH